MGWNVGTERNVTLYFMLVLTNWQNFDSLTELVEKRTYQIPSAAGTTKYLLRKISPLHNLQRDSLDFEVRNRNATRNKIFISAFSALPFTGENHIPSSRFSLTTPPGTNIELIKLIYTKGTNPLGTKKKTRVFHGIDFRVVAKIPNWDYTPLFFSLNCFSIKHPDGSGSPEANRWNVGIFGEIHWTAFRNDFSQM